ncbi:MAG: hypothetical protein CMI73_01545 [Candidatus Pelagibacter sp.]|nr:hypothetical protein [Candidatus Pelagibacter sp.]OUV87960.1 MAG: hypothetical protein CBC96_01250 [Pelagibacteraceae bacterium TMED136]|tara:strand:+ start:4534 stop:5451 length:918 start_codon:yes stop_codon:yes gene_type:complete
MKKILIIQKRIGIGDFCVFLPPINEISKLFSKYQVNVMTKERTQAKEFIFDHNYINEVFYAPDLNIFKESIWIYNHIKNLKYEKCFIFHYSLRYFLLAKLAGVKNVFSYGFFKKNENIVKKSQEFINEKLNYKNNNFEFHINYNENVQKKEQIVFGIGGSGRDKKWDINNYIELAKLLNQIKKFKFVLAGGKNEAEDANYIIKNLKNNNIEAISVCELNIKSTLPFLMGSKLYVGNDTGFMHLSGCFGVQSFGLFGRTSINYSSYNKNIVPISLPESQMSNISRPDAINFIEPEYVLNFLQSTNL